MACTFRMSDNRLDDVGALLRHKCHAHTAKPGLHDGIRAARCAPPHITPPKRGEAGVDCVVSGSLSGEVRTHHAGGVAF